MKKINHKNLNSPRKVHKKKIKKENIESFQTIESTDEENGENNKEIQTEEIIESNTSTIESEIEESKDPKLNIKVFRSYDIGINSPIQSKLHDSNTQPFVEKEEGETVDTKNSKLKIRPKIINVKSTKRKSHKSIPVILGEKDDKSNSYNQMKKNLMNEIKNINVLHPNLELSPDSTDLLFLDKMKDYKNKNRNLFVSEILKTSNGDIEIGTKETNSDPSLTLKKEKISHINSQNITSIEKSGWLYKKGRMKNWSKRWFVLSEKKMGIIIFFCFQLFFFLSLIFIHFFFIKN